MYVDPKTGIGVTLSYQEYLQSAGSRYIVNENNTFTNDNRIYFFTTPSAKSVVLTTKLNSVGITQLDIYENPTVSITGLTGGNASISGGSNSASYIFNANRQESGASTTVTLSANPVIYTTSGTLIYSGVSVSGYPNINTLTLAAGTHYLINVSGVGNVNRTNWQFDWTEK